MNYLEYIFLIGIGIIIYLLVDIRTYLKVNEVDTYPTHLFGISKDGEIHPIIAMGKTRNIYAEKQWAVHVRHNIDENGESKPEIWTWPIEYYKSILGYDPTKKDGYSDDIINEIKSYNISDDKKLSLEEFIKLKNDIFDLINEPNDFYNVAGLPIEECAAKRAYRFLLLMNEYKYLTKNNLPEIESTSDGGICLKFGYGNSWYEIIFPPEDNQPIYSCRFFLDDTTDNVEDYRLDRFNAGYSNNPLEILHELVATGELIDS